MNGKTWNSVHESIHEDTECLEDGGFVAIDYRQEVEGAASPYAQIARTGNRFWCEISSNTFLPGDSWPLYGDLLRSAGWSPPNTDFPNWYSEWSNANAAATAVIHGLRYGRGCTSPGLMEWHTAAAPPQRGFVAKFSAMFRGKRQLRVL